MIISHQGETSDPQHLATGGVRGYVVSLDSDNSPVRRLVQVWQGTPVCSCVLWRHGEQPSYLDFRAGASKA